MSFKSSRRGVPAIRARREAALGAVSYPVKVLGYGPIAYWPLWETAGATAQCLVNTAQNGTYTGVTLANGTAPDGSPCPYFDGTNDYVATFTATLAGAFNGAEGTLAIWCRVFNIGVWTDGANRYAVDVDYENPVPGAEYWRFYKSSTNQRLSYRRRGDAVTESYDVNGITDTNWFHLAMSWSESADTVIYYWNGGSLGSTTVLGAWVSPIDSATIGASNLVPTNVWHGWLAHCAVWNTPLTAPQIADLATV